MGWDKLLRNSKSAESLGQGRECCWATLRPSFFVIYLVIYFSCYSIKSTSMCEYFLHLWQGLKFYQVSLSGHWITSILNIRRGDRTEVTRSKQHLSVLSSYPIFHPTRIPAFWSPCLTGLTCRRHLKTVLCPHISWSITAEKAATPWEAKTKYGKLCTGRSQSPVINTTVQETQTYKHENYC